MEADVERLFKLIRKLSGDYRVRFLGEGEGELTLYAEGAGCSALIRVSTSHPVCQLVPREDGWDYLLLASGEGIAASAAFKLNFPERHPALPLLLSMLAGFLLEGVTPGLVEPRLKQVVLLLVEELTAF